ncbi:MAG: FGGY family carbohydrate kinase [Actinomycetota bacterium]
MGVDIGTSSSKGVIVDFDGRVLATATREHAVSRPAPGMAEMDADIWWSEFVAISAELLAAAEGEIVAIGVSGMGPCVVVTDAAGVPLRPAILYGIDTRATAQIRAQSDRFGADEVLARAGSALSTQAVGPKLAWIADNEPAVWARVARLFMPNSWLAWKLTGEYVLDHHSASQSVPLYDTDANEWYAAWCRDIAPALELPRLLWPEDTAGTVGAVAARQTGLPEGIPVIIGTIDAWTEAISVGAVRPGDLMLMYGTTMFLVSTIRERITVSGLWGTVGAFRSTRSLAGGMATSGAITSWLRDLAGSPSYEDLLAEAERSGAGAHGLLMLPYFAGERTPIADPAARGVIAGLTIEHTRGDLYRAALEATAFGVRHNVHALRTAGAAVDRVIAVGGGTQGALWLQLVSDITGLAQRVPAVTIGAAYGAAYLAALALSDVSIDTWNPEVAVIEPRPEFRDGYDRLWRLYLELYPATASIVHGLAEGWSHS